MSDSLRSVIDTQEKLSRFIPLVESAEWIAIDTEANSLYAYPPRLCLIQASLPGTDAIIDPLASINLSSLFEILSRHELILHGADYDLRLLWKHFQFRPGAVFDTMWAARLLGYTEFGLTHLVSKLLGVPLEKGPQKMNWARRPLTDRMERYARNDTHYLQPLAGTLAEQLKRAGRLDWQRETCDRLIRECTQYSEPDADRLWRVKGSNSLKGRSLAVLRELWTWREKEAIRRDKPPYFVLSNEKLIEISATAGIGHPISHFILRKSSPSTQSGVREAIDRALCLPRDACPRPLKNTGERLTEREKKQYDAFKQRRDKHASDLNIDPSIIASRAALVSLARGPDGTNDLLLPWQHKLLSDH